MGSEESKTLGFHYRITFADNRIIEFKVDYPGNYILVDHALSRLDRGAWGILKVEGKADDTVFKAEQ